MGELSESDVGLLFERVGDSVASSALMTDALSAFVVSSPLMLFSSKGGIADIMLAVCNFAVMSRMEFVIGVKLLL